MCWGGDQKWSAITVSFFLFFVFLVQRHLRTGWKTRIGKITSFLSIPNLFAILAGDSIYKAEPYCSDRLKGYMWRKKKINQILSHHLAIWGGSTLLWFNRYPVVSQLQLSGERYESRVFLNVWLEKLMFPGEESGPSTVNNCYLGEPGRWTCRAH